MKNYFFKRLYFYIATAVAFLVHLPVAYSATKIFLVTKDEHKIVIPFIDDEHVATANKIYDSLKLNFIGLSENAFNYAIDGLNFLKASGKIANENIISIIDFTKPSSQKRLFVLDLQHNKILFNTYVAHGQGSGGDMATAFSNVPESFQSSLGFYKTESTYFGKNGFSLKLNGLENGINNNADERAIVVHGAAYVSEAIAQSQGHIGRSWGCPAVPQNLNKPIIDKIKNGTCLFIYSQNSKYLRNSRIINN